MKVSKTMQQCIDSMRTHDRLIERHPGGFWRCEPTGGYSFGTSTVEALVSRHIAEYTRWQEGRNGRFPIEAKLIPDLPAGFEPGAVNAPLGTKREPAVVGPSGNPGESCSQNSISTKP